MREPEMKNTRTWKIIFAVFSSAFEKRIFFFFCIFSLKLDIGLSGGGGVGGRALSRGKNLSVPIYLKILPIYSRFTRLHRT